MRFIEPAVMGSVLCGIGPVTVVACKLISERNWVARHAAVTSLAALTGTGLLVCVTATGRSGITEAVDTRLGRGIAATVLAGTMQAATILCVKTPSERGWFSKQIMAHRFYVLCFAAFVCVGASARLFDLTWAEGGMLVALAAYSVALPLWLLQ